MASGTETCEEEVQPSPLNAEEVRFFFLSGIRTAEMVGFTVSRVGSVRGFAFLGFLNLVCSAMTESSAANIDILRVQKLNICCFFLSYEGKKDGGVSLCEAGTCIFVLQNLKRL